MVDLKAQTRYDPSEVEPRIAARWLQSGLFHPDPEGTAAENYSLAIPPPNVTGVLHMGHALNNSIQDCLARHHRMRGQRVKWILGTDHAGIATQTQVERSLVEQGSSRVQIGRDRFVERVWQWREEYGGTIVEQLKRLGASCDYDVERFTMDELYAQAVLRVFVALYEKGYIYRDRYMVNWDPGSGSAISDLEVEQREVTDTLYSIDYPLASGSGAITVATVRPETMLADSAIAVNPQDERYRRLIGETAILPLVGRKLRIIADDYVRPEFGTGALKITPAHDSNDFEIGRRHSLAQPTAIGEDGRITADAPERFQGLGIAEAQRAVVSELDAQGLLARTEPYAHTVPFSQRSGQRIEPLISLQWFMAMEQLAAPAIEAVTSGRVRFHPANYAKVYLDWMHNIRPWCISRQLWWGHRLPVWYRDLETYVGIEPPRGEGWERDPDVLDTWFSSALWPFVTLGWPEQTPELRAFYPTDALVTGRDIIFLWVARMIMMGLEFTGAEPFSDVHITAIIQAPDGRRMSKSLGTGVDPTDLIDGGPRPPVFEQLDDSRAALPGDSGGRARGEGAGRRAGEFPAYGADAVRWGLLAMSSGQDVRFSEDKVAQGQQLTNKLWNATRLILLGVSDRARAAVTPTSVEDRWMLSRLARARAEVTSRIDGFDFSHAALALYDFVYGELCDWYLELVKPRLRAGEPELEALLLHVLTETVALAHPIIPFETEEIYAHIPGTEGLLAARVDAAMAGSPAAAIDGAAEAAVQRAIAAVQGLRSWRDQAGVRASATLPARLDAIGYEDTREHVARLARLSLNGAGDDEPVVASVPVPGGTVEIIEGPELDLAASARRRDEQRAKLRSEIERAERKLANEGFVAKAPPAVVGAERDKLARLREELEAL
ncbi:MAG: valine--tRNA ligase [Solirubrobacterales bacterium]|nr:valine--tRNA ligase [Solirubrobacterales bacterium]